MAYGPGSSLELLRVFLSFCVPVGFLDLEPHSRYLEKVRISA